MIMSGARKTIEWARTGFFPPFSKERTWSEVVVGTWAEVAHHPGNFSNKSRRNRRRKNAAPPPSEKMRRVDESVDNFGVSRKRFTPSTPGSSAIWWTTTAQLFYKLLDSLKAMQSEALWTRLSSISSPVQCCWCSCSILGLHITAVRWQHRHARSATGEPTVRYMHVPVVVHSLP